MGEIIYKPLIDDMVWSFSRLNSYECPYRWFLKYLNHSPETEKFYSGYGKLMHNILEQYYNGKLSKENMLSEFLIRFSDEIQGERPPYDTVQKYIKQGSDYLKSFQPLPFEMIAVEQEVKFDIDGFKFIGFIDFLGIDNDEYVIVDNKSKCLKPRSKRLKPTKTDKELDDMLKQLYLYSKAVFDMYGKYPKELCFNCFRTNTLIREPFKIDAYHDTIQWAKDRINTITYDTDFLHNYNYFTCKYICGVNEDCIYYKDIF